MNSPRLPEGRWGHAGAGLVVCGGGERAGPGAGTCVELDPGAGRWDEIHALVRARTDHTVWRTQTEELALLGGWGAADTSEVRQGIVNHDAV